MTLLTFCFRTSQVSTAAIDAPDQKAESSRPVLHFNVTDRETGKPTATRFGVRVNGKDFFPTKLNQHGLRFVSIHESKKQVYVVTYTRGTGPVAIDLPRDAHTVEVYAAKGFEFLPQMVERKVTARSMSVDISLQRWANPGKKGWFAADEHVHYDRLDAAGDKDWLTMLDGDGLTHAHFMVLKGGKVPGLWACQYAYGKKGEAADGQRLIRSGEEYRDSAQGHINLLGLSEVIQPISTGGLGKPPVRVNYPPLHDVFVRNRELGGMGGVAHGGSLGRHPTAVADTILGAVDFFEIGNAHLYALDLWYKLMNCGFDLPPAAGTDLPNFPFRDRWQPFLGSMRMYVKTGERRDFEAWKRAVKKGEVLVTSGPLLTYAVNSAGPGGTVELPSTGGIIKISAELSSPIGLRKFELIQNGKPIPVQVVKSKSNNVQRWKIEHKLHVTTSCWLAVRGEGVPIKSMEASIAGKASWIKTDAIAHSSAIRVIVGGKPIRSKQDATNLLTLLRTQREYYRTMGRYEQAQHRLRVLELFEKAIAELEKRF